MTSKMLSFVLNASRARFSGIKNAKYASLMNYSTIPMSENGPNPYVVRDNESVTDKRARLLYQSRKRGMLENGLILSTFAGKYLNSFNELQLNLYDKLINLPSNDWDLYYWATGVRETPREFESEVMELLKRHVKNELKETRFKQPDLY